MSFLPGSVVPLRTGSAGDPADRARRPEEGPTPAQRLRRARREEALGQIGRARLAMAYATGEDVYLGRGDFWRWRQDGIPAWLVPSLRDAGLLPGDAG
ncbi:MAG: hypothetical protein VKI81_06290 [Synechococcaceae cyanobacterium]|nr:hypothetical protein [Synechococcaceae cyanobacterium]